MHFLFQFPVQRTLVGLIATLGLVGQAAWAKESQGTPGIPLTPNYKQECGACHMAYPSGLLPAASWQRVMNNLQRHFGSDASLDPATAKQLLTWLTANAGVTQRVREEPPEDRITRSAWFIREHHELAAATWKLTAVKSAANCTACHNQAAQGDFNEHNVRIPR